MQYAAHLPALSSTRSVVVPLVALVVGAGAATGTYALIDNADEGAQASKVIVVESPAPGPAGLELRGSKASTTSSSDDAATAIRTDPHGVASSLRDR